MQLLCGSVLPVWPSLLAALRSKGGARRESAALPVKKCTIDGAILIGVVMSAEQTDAFKRLMSAEEGGTEAVLVAAQVTSASAPFFFWRRNHLAVSATPEFLTLTLLPAVLTLEQERVDRERHERSDEMTEERMCRDASERAVAGWRGGGRGGGTTAEDEDEDESALEARLFGDGSDDDDGLALLFATETAAVEQIQSTSKRREGQSSTSGGGGRGGRASASAAGGGGASGGRAGDRPVRMAAASVAVQQDAEEDLDLLLGE